MGWHQGTRSETRKVHVVTTAVAVCTTLVKDGVTLPCPCRAAQDVCPHRGLPDTLRQAIREHTAGLMTLLTPDSTHGVPRDCAVSPPGQPQWSVLSSGGVQCLRCLVPMGHAPQEVSA